MPQSPRTHTGGSARGGGVRGSTRRNDAKVEALLDEILRRSDSDHRAACAPVPVGINPSDRDRRAAASSASADAYARGSPSPFLLPTIPPHATHPPASAAASGHTRGTNGCKGPVLIITEERDTLWIDIYVEDVEWKSVQIDR